MALLGYLAYLPHGFLGTTSSRHATRRFASHDTSAGSVPIPVMIVYYDSLLCMTSQPSKDTLYVPIFKKLDRRWLALADEWHRV